MVPTQIYQTRVKKNKGLTFNRYHNKSTITIQVLSMIDRFTFAFVVIKKICHFFIVEFLLYCMEYLRWLMPNINLHKSGKCELRLLRIKLNKVELDENAKKSRTHHYIHIEKCFAKNNFIMQLT